MIDRLRIRPRVLLNLLVRLRLRERAELTRNPPLPGRCGCEPADGLDAFADGEDVEGGREVAGVYYGGGEGVGCVQCYVPACVSIDRVRGCSWILEGREGKAYERSERS